MCLFFNVCYFPFWLLVALTITYIKYEYLNYLYKFVLVTVLVAAVFIEVTRLYLGYLGNLTEKVKIFHVFLYQSCTIFLIGSRTSWFLAINSFAAVSTAGISSPQ